MPTKVHLPDGRVVNFPDGMPPEAIQAEVAKLSPAEATPEPAAPTGPRPGSPQAMLADTIGAPATNALATAARATPLGLGVDLLEHGAGAGGMFGGAVGGALSGGLAAVPLAAAGGAAGGALQRWFRGEPTTGGDVAWDAGVEGTIQGVAPIAGKALTAAAKPLYRMALRPGGPLTREFGDVSARGLQEGLPVNADSIAAAGDRTTASRGAAMGMVRDAEAAGASKVTNAEIQPALDPVFTKARNAAAVGGEPPVGRLIDRSRKLAKTLGDDGVPLSRAQTLKEAAQDEAAAAFKAVDQGARVSSLDDEAAKAGAVGFQKAIEARAPGVGAQNLNTKQLVGLIQALEKAEARRQGGAGIPLSARLANLLTQPGVSSRVAIGMDRTGRALTPNRVSGSVRALQALLQDQQE